MRKLFKPVDFNEKAIEKSIEDNGIVVADVKYDGVRQSLAVNMVDETLTFQTYAQEILDCLEWVTDNTQSPFFNFLKSYKQDDCCIYTKGMGFVLDLELCIRGLSFNESSGILRSKWLSDKNIAYHYGEDTRTKKTDKVRFKLNPECVDAYLIDVLPLESLCDHAESEVSIFTALRLVHREVMLQSLMKHPIAGLRYESVESYDVGSMDELTEIYERVSEAGHEGLVVKDVMANYKSGKKSGWWKMKPDDSADGKVIGLVWGTGKNNGKVVGFEVELEDGLVVKATGITESQMEEFTNNVIADTVEAVGVSDIDSVIKSGVNPYTDRYCQVNYMERFLDGSLRHPSFGGWRGTESNPKDKA